MDDDVAQAYARLNVHEFVLETIMARWIATMPQKEGDAIISEFVGAWDAPTAPRDQLSVDDERAFQILQDAAYFAQNFSDRVSRQASEIRAKLAQADDPEE